MSSDLGSPGKRGHSPQRVAAPRCHGGVGLVPGQPDPGLHRAPLTGVGLSSDHFTLPLSHLTPSIPQGEGCNRTARAGLEGQEAPIDRGKSKQRGSQAAEGDLGSRER